MGRILGDYGAFVVSRKGTDVEKALRSLKRWRRNIYVSVTLCSLPSIADVCQVFEPPSTNDTSSTKVRAYVKRRQSIENLTPDPVIGYIEEHGLYQNEGEPSKGPEEG